MSDSADAKVALAIQTCMGALSTLSSKEKALVLKALGGMNNLVVQAPFQIAAQQRGRDSREQSSRAANNGKASSTPNPANKDPKVLEAKAALKENAAAIKAELKKLGLTGKDDHLPEDHPLVEARARLNVLVKSFRDQVANTSTEVTSVKGKETVGPTAQSAAGPSEFNA